MKRILLSLLALGVVLAATSAFIITRPSVQKKIVLSQLHSAGIEADVSEIQAGLSRLTLRDLKLTLADSTQVSLGSLDANYSLLSILRGYYNLDVLTIDALAVTLPTSEATGTENAHSTSVTESTAKDAFHFEGIFNQIQGADLRWRLGKFSLTQSSITVANTGTMELEASSDGFEPNTTGTLNYSLRYRPQAGVESTLPDAIHGSITVTLDARSRPSGLTLDTVLDNLGNQYRLKASAQANADSTAEDYAVQLEHIPAQSAGTQSLPQILFYLNGQYLYGKHPMGFGAKYRVAIDDHALNGMGLPIQIHAINLAATGEIKVNTQDNTSDFEGTLRLNLPQPEAWENSLANVGAMGLQSHYALGLTPTTLAVRHLNAQVNSIHAPDLIRLESLRAFEFPLQQLGADFDLPVGELARLRLRLPLELIKILAPESPLQAKGLLEGGFDLSAAANNAFSLKSTESLKLTLQDSTFAGEPYLKSFTASTDLAVNYTESLITLKLDSLSLIQENQALATGAFQGTIALAPLRIEGTLPLSLVAQQPVSEVELHFNYDTLEPSQKNRIQLTGNRLVVEHLTALIDRLTPRRTVTEAPAQDAPPAKPNQERDTEPFWSAAQGSVSVDIAEVRYQHYDFRQVKLQAQADPSKLELAQFNAQLFDAPLDLKGRFTFDSQSPRAYDFKGTLGVQKLSLGKAFNISGWIEGLFSLDAQVEGQGDNLEAVLDQFMGELSLKSDEGTLYFVEQGAGLVGSLSGVLNQTGGLLDGVLNASLGVDTKILSSVTGFMQQLSFYDFDVAVKRAADLDLIFERIRIDGAMMSVNGSGKVNYSDGISLIKQPLDLTLELGAKDALAKGLGSLGLLKTEQDARGYFKAYSFPVTGSLGKPKFAVFNALEALINKINPLGLKSKTEADAASVEKTPPATLEDTAKDAVKKVGEEAVKGLLKGLF